MSGADIQVNTGNIIDYSKHRATRVSALPALQLHMTLAALHGSIHSLASQDQSEMYNCNPGLGNFTSGLCVY